MNKKLFIKINSILFFALGLWIALSLLYIIGLVAFTSMSFGTGLPDGIEQSKAGSAIIGIILFLIGFGISTGFILLGRALWKFKKGVGIFTLIFWTHNFLISILILTFPDSGLGIPLSLLLAALPLAPLILMILGWKELK